MLTKTKNPAKRKKTPKTDIAAVVASIGLTTISMIFQETAANSMCYRGVTRM